MDRELLMVGPPSDAEVRVERIRGLVGVVVIVFAVLLVLPHLDLRDSQPQRVTSSKPLSTPSEDVSSVRAPSDGSGAPGAVAPRLIQVNHEFAVSIPSIEGAQVVVNAVAGPCSPQSIDPPTFVAKVTGTCELRARSMRLNGEAGSFDQTLFVLVARSKGVMTVATEAMFGVEFAVAEVEAGGLATADVLAGTCVPTASSPLHFIALGRYCTFSVEQQQDANTVRRHIEVTVAILAAMPL
ncbi:MAG: hypothetical protein GY724_30305 [Actinomycetia bacterium]|nr:hypothetical protein [Actinomycetes bacterium]MCP4225246.1 hypothetical protein [Actinomycetes bacterium]MCP5034522.1 hypothetical protein [Actinomycetes bacterium]